MKKSTILSALFIIFLFSLVLPNAYAASGQITLENNEFTLYRGSTISFPVIIQMSDYTHNPSLEIIHNGEVTQKISLYSIGDTFYSTIGLNENWSSGNYIINLTYQGIILDSKSFVILRDNEVASEIIVYENMSEIVAPHIFLGTDSLVLENSSHEIIYITGSISTSQTGHIVVIDVKKPDGSIYTLHAFPKNDGTFAGLIPIDKSWTSGEYEVSASYFGKQIDSKSFIIQNNWEKPLFTESQIIGSFDIASEVSHDYTILRISGDVQTNESEITLVIAKDDTIMHQDIVSLDNGAFETSTVLYDYAKNAPWEYGDYQIIGQIGEKTFHSKKFTLDAQSFTIPQIQSMNLFMQMKNQIQKMVDILEVEIYSGDIQQIILSGTIEDYDQEDSVTVHLINPDGVDTESYLIASNKGDYYLPMFVDDTWVSGQYTAYVTYGDFVDEPSSFSVINHAIKIKDETVKDTEVINDIIEIKNYSISFSDNVTSSSVHYTATLESYSGKTPVVISLNDEIISESFTYSANRAIDYYLLLDNTWSSGNYTVSYIENNIATPFGTFEILGDEKITQDSIDENNSEIIHTTLSLDKTVFKIADHFVDTVSFSGVADYTGDVTVSLDGKIISHMKINSDGEYEGIIFLPDELDAGFHNVSVQYGSEKESAEFLIATNNAIPLTKDITISRDEILKAGGAITISVSGMMSDFVPSEIQPVLVEISGVKSQSFSVMPKMYGYYFQNFVLSDTLGEYEVMISYDGDILESHFISVVPADFSWVKSHTQSLVNGEMNYVSYLSKAVLVLDESYEVPSDVTCPEWFYESSQMWLDGTMSDESFYDAVEFLAENESSRS